MSYSKTRIGVTGLPGTGKSTLIALLTEFLTKRGIPCCRFSLSDEVRQITAYSKRELSRPNLQETANFLRKRYGNDVIAELLCRRITSTSGTDETAVWLFDGIRTPEEVQTLRDHFGEHFLLAGLVVPNEKAISRLRSRARLDEDPRISGTMAAATSLLSEENGSSQPSYGINISGAVSAADELIENSGSIPDLQVEAARLAEMYIFPAFRPEIEVDRENLHI
jgi:dephospho-CoA kinase